MPTPWLIKQQCRLRFPSVPAIQQLTQRNLQLTIYKSADYLSLPRWRMHFRGTSTPSYPSLAISAIAPSNSRNGLSALSPSVSFRIPHKVLYTQSFMATVTGGGQQGADTPLTPHRKIILFLFMSENTQTAASQMSHNPPRIVT